MTQDNSSDTEIESAKYLAAVEAKKIASLPSKSHISKVDRDLSKNFIKWTKVKNIAPAIVAENNNTLNQIKQGAIKAATILGTLLLSKGEPEDSIYAYNFARNIGSKSKDLVALLGDAYYATENYGRSIEHYTEAINLNHQQTAILKCYVGNAYYEMKNWDKSLQFYEAAINEEYFVKISDFPGSTAISIETRTKIGFAYLNRKNSGDCQAAVWHFKAALGLCSQSQDTDITRINLGIGEATIGVGDSKKHTDPQEAQVHYNKALEYLYKASSSNFWDVQVSTGNAYYRLGYYTEALSCYNKAKLGCTNPVMEEIFFREGVVYLTTTQYSPSIVCFQKALELSHPNKALIEERMATSYLHLGLYNDAKRHYKRSRKCDDHDDLRINAGMGEVYFMRGEYDEAIKSFELIKEKDSSHFTWAQSRIGDTYFVKNDWQNAIDFFKSAIESSNKAQNNECKLGDARIVEIKYNLSLSHMSLNEHQEAIKLSKEVIKTGLLEDSWVFYIMFNIGKSCFALSRDDEGMEYLEKAKTLVPDMANIIEDFIKSSFEERESTTNAASDADSGDKVVSDTEEERGAKRARVMSEEEELSSDSESYGVSDHEDNQYYIMGKSSDSDSDSDYSQE